MMPIGDMILHAIDKGDEGCQTNASMYLDFEPANSDERAPCDSAMSTTSMYRYIHTGIYVYVGVG